MLFSCYRRFFFFSSRRRHTRYWRDWSSDVCSSDLGRRAFFLRGRWRGLLVVCLAVGACLHLSFQDSLQPLQGYAFAVSSLPCDAWVRRVLQQLIEGIGGAVHSRYFGQKVKTVIMLTIHMITLRNELPIFGVQLCKRRVELCVASGAG